MQTPLSDIKPALYAYIPLGIAGMYVHLNFSQADISYFINSYHTIFLDVICKYGTYLGDGWIYAIVSAVLFFFNRKAAFIFCIAGILSSLMAQGLKHFAFEDALRPIMVLDADKIHLVNGIEPHKYLSFPSGHTTSAFTMFALISFYVKNPVAKIACLLPAIFAGYTRIYLLQHFFEDVLFGSMLGLLCAMIVYYVMNLTQKENAA